MRSSTSSPKEKATTKAAPSACEHSRTSQQDDGRTIFLQKQGLTRGIGKRRALSIPSKGIKYSLKAFLLFLLARKTGYIKKILYHDIKIISF